MPLRAALCLQDYIQFYKIGMYLKLNTIYTYLLDNCLASSVYLRNFECGLSSNPPGAGGLFAPAELAPLDTVDGNTVVLFRGIPALEELEGWDDFKATGSGITPSLTKCILDK